MPSLAETQALLRGAIVADRVAAVLPLIFGGANPTARLAIHTRHYRASLVRALATKFQATVWLIGGRALTEVAKDFVAASPPDAPCIGEYGEDFPDFLAGHPACTSMPCAAAMARLDWFLGHASVAVGGPPLPLDGLASLAPEALPDASLALQPGLYFLAEAWPVDDLARLYLTGTAPERYELAPAAVWLQVSGARGGFRIDRLAPGGFAFRRALAAGRTIAAAADAAAAAEAGFDAGAALVALFNAGLVAGLRPAEKGR